MNNLKTIEELKEKYNLELEKIVSQVKNKKAKMVLLQFPDGLKPYAISVVDFLKTATNAEFLIWFGSCYGACDIPASLERMKPKIDLIIQFGHNEMMPSY